MAPAVTACNEIQCHHGKTTRSMTSWPATPRACFMEQAEVFEPLLFLHCAAIQSGFHRAVNARVTFEKVDHAGDHRERDHDKQQVATVTSSEA
ncbi:hypothetical protein ALQ56_200323 [Pseudomonas syringae pv. papulans]|nr:hypothetical protein ALQ56_200323 [Pseudomonas syringae pv. papulans]